MKEIDKYIYAISVITCVVVLAGKWVLNRDSKSNPTQGIKAVEQVSENQRTGTDTPSLKLGQAIDIVEKNSENRGISKGNPSPFGIEIGKSTKDEIKSKFRVIEEGLCRFNKGYTTFYLDTKDFSSKELPVEEVELTFDQNEKVIQLRLIYDCKNFSKLHEIFLKKYKILYSKVPLVGDKIELYICNNILITINEPHVGFKMILVYCTKKFGEEIEEYYQRQREEEQKRLEAQL